MSEFSTFVGNFFRGLRCFMVLSSMAISCFGCAVGPTAISMGRSQYNEVITRTENEQLLMLIIRNRFAETYNILSVTNVAASLRFTAKAGVNLGFGPQSNYAGGLVPFSGGVAYEENPTISYTPTRGRDFMRRLYTPIPMEFLILTLRASIQPEMLFRLLVKQVNNMRNPVFLDPELEHDGRFPRFLSLNMRLLKKGVAEWVEGPEGKNKFRLLIHNYAPRETDTVREFLKLLRIPFSGDTSRAISIPVHFAAVDSQSGTIGIITRSTTELLDILSGCMEIPEGYAAVPFPPKELPGLDLRIHASLQKPENAFLAVKYRDYWFYIDRDDLRTKSAFLYISGYWDVAVTHKLDAQTAPVLTIPVGR